VTATRSEQDQPGWYRRQSKSIGFITPSGNLIVERVTSAILRDFPLVSAHHSRTSVKGNSDPFPQSYDWQGMMGAAHLLGDARPDVICWNGSKAGSIGFDLDRDLCGRIEYDTGCPATTSTLAIEAVLKRRGVRRIALVTPYMADYQQKIVRTFAAEGFDCVAEAHARIDDNLAFAFIDDQVIGEMFERVAAAKPDAIVTYCTNFPAAHLVAPYEARFGIPIYDSVSVGVWHALQCIGMSTTPGAQWGSLFANGGEVLA
jgi:maleate isomerase